MQGSGIFCGMKHRSIYTCGLCIVTVYCIRAQTPQIDIYIDADETNTVAVGGSPDPFFDETPGTDNLWRYRPGYGFDVNGNTEIFEKDATSGGNGVGDAAPLTTTISGLIPGQKYGLYVCFLSVPTEAWRVRAGLSLDDLTEFQPTTPAGRVWDLGLSGVPNSNRNQYLGYMENAVADANGEIVVYVDDGEGTSSSARTWYEGLAVGPPILDPGGSVEVAPDGAWTWFNDERAIFHKGYLFSGYVMGDGRYGVTCFDPASGNSSNTVVSTGFSQQRDDHNNPSITVLPDERLLIVYSKHGAENQYYYRRSKVPVPMVLSDWNDEQVKTTPARNTYANTYCLSGETNTIYNFHRCINFNPTVTRSTDNGVSWGTPVHFITSGTGGVRPYPRYCSNHRDRIDLIYTDGHPRDIDNSVYHLYYCDGGFFKTDGNLVDFFVNLPLDHDAGERGSVVYPYTSRDWETGEGPDDFIPGGRGWTWDVCYGKDGNPVCVFQVQKDEVTGTGWNNDRIYYYYARWTGSEWQRRFIAHGGRGLYSSEDDYGGGMTIDSEDPRVVYISSNALEPFNLSVIDNVPLNTHERYEIYRGVTRDGGLSFSWEQITVDSLVDNLRPIVPENHGFRRALLWFAGTYTSYTSFDTRVLGIFKEHSKGTLLVVE